MKNLILERIGETGFNNFGSKMIVIEYNNSSDIWVKFEKGRPVHTNWRNFLKGEVKNLYDISVQDVGYIGEGNYKPTLNGKDTPQYTIWTGILKRCYDEKFHKNYPTYQDCTVCNEWHNFQTFAKWYDENYYKIEGETMCLDKDILVKDNKVYSPNTCVFVPEFINNLFVKSNALRGKLPIGVTFLKNKMSPYQVRCRNEKRQNVTIGYYKSPEDAFQAYKVYKENVIKQIAEKYKDKIPEKLYWAMLNYKVHITD